MSENIGEVRIVIEDHGGGGDGAAPPPPSSLGGASFAPHPLAGIGGGRSAFAQQVVNSIWNDATRLSKPPPPPPGSFGPGSAAAAGAGGRVLGAIGSAAVPLSILAAAATAAALALNRAKATVQSWMDSLRESEMRLRPFSPDVAAASAESRLAEVMRSARASQEFGGTVADSIRARTAMENALAPISNAIDRLKAALAGEFYRSVTLAAGALRDLAAVVAGLLRGVIGSITGTARAAANVSGAAVTTALGAAFPFGGGALASLVMPKAETAFAIRMTMETLLGPLDRISGELGAIKGSLQREQDQKLVDGVNAQYVKALGQMTLGAWHPRR